MSKALVIKGANFATNKVATVTLIEVIPCTGLTISANTLTFTTIGATSTLTATPTPTNTTDAIVWTSSNEEVATVVGGVVTCAGVGACTITATCGEQSATCAVSSTVTVDANEDLMVTNLRNIQSTDLASGKNYVGVSEAGESGTTTNVARSRFYSSDDESLGYYKFHSGIDDVVRFGYPIPIPNNTTKIKIVTSGGFKLSSTFTMLVLMDGTALTTYNISGRGAKAVSDFIRDTVVDGNTVTFDISEYTGYNSFVFQLLSNSVSADQLTGSVSVEFS